MPTSSPPNSTIGEDAVVSIELTGKEVLKQNEIDSSGEVRMPKGRQQEDMIIEFFYKNNVYEVSFGGNSFAQIPCRLFEQFLTALYYRNRSSLVSTSGSFRVYLVYSILA